MVAKLQITKQMVIRENLIVVPGYSLQTVFAILDQHCDVFKFLLCTKDRETRCNLVGSVETDFQYIYW